MNKDIRLSTMIHGHPTISLTPHSNKMRGVSWVWSGGQLIIMLRLYLLRHVRKNICF